MNFFTRTDQSYLGRWWWTVDRVTLALIVTLCIFGVVLVTTASPSVAERIGAPSNHFVINHVIFLLPSVGAMLFLSMLNLQQVWRAALLCYAFSIVCMILVLLYGTEIKGAQRWITLGPLGSLQPSELAKPSLIITAAWFLAKFKERGKFQNIMIAAGLYGLVVLLLLMQPDMGMTFVVTASFMTLIFLAGLPFRWIVLLIVMAMGAAVLAYFSFSHVQKRFDLFLDPKSGDTYQIDRSMQAFRHGGLFGTGAGQGTVKTTIPDSHADFIFAVAGEELGLIFTLFIVGIYGYIVVRGYYRIMDTDNMFIILAAGGLLTMFGLQAFINMGSSLHLLPTKGMTLPFISYGGSSLLSTGISAGMLLALTRRQGRSGIARGGLSIRPIGGNVK